MNGYFLFFLMFNFLLFEFLLKALVLRLFYEHKCKNGHSGNGGEGHKDPSLIAEHSPGRAAVFHVAEANEPIHAGPADSSVALQKYNGKPFCDLIHKDGSNHYAYPDEHLFFSFRVKLIQKGAKSPLF